MTLLSFIALAAFIILIFVQGLSATFNLLLINPLINALIVLDRIVLGEFGLAIILFTVLLRVVTLPFTVNQFRSMKNMQAAQPIMQEIQKKYKDPKRRTEEMQRVYKEYGINPLGCLMPFAIQMLVFIALYQALVVTVGGSPESLVGLSQRLYNWPFLHETVPLKQHFLWLDLGRPDATFLVPILVFVSTYVQQKVSMQPAMNEQMRQQQALMTWMMPMVIAIVTLGLPSGVGIYWVVSNIFSLFVSYYVYGREFNWRNLLPGTMPTVAEPQKGVGGRVSRKDGAGEPEEETRATEPAAAGAKSREARRSHGKRRGKRKNRR
jgi:YidC/Oxa1 family membrane protein insertase